MKVLYLKLFVALIFLNIGTSAQNILTSITGPCSGGTYDKAKDGKPSTSFYWHSGAPCAFEMVLHLSGISTPKAVLVKINASKAGIGIENYYTTQTGVDEFYYVNPTGFSTLTISNPVNISVSPIYVYEIEVINIPLDGVALNYGYDNAGNMYSREIVIGSAKSAEIVSNENTEIIGESTYETNSDSKNDAEIPDASTKNQFDEMLGQNSISIYPNPTQGQLRVAIGDIQPDDKISVTVHSLAGARLFSGTLNDNLIDLNDAASGVYILTIVVNDKSQNWRIVKE
jgi:hypothetical protein